MLVLFAQKWRTMVALAGAWAAAAAACNLTINDSGGSGGGNGADPCNGVPVAGHCKDAATIESCFVSERSGVAPKVVTRACDAKQEQCTVDASGARCALKPGLACYDATTQCKDSSTLQTCVNNAWTDMDCGGASCSSQPPSGAACVANTPDTGIHLTGKLQYEYLDANKDLTDYDPNPVTAPAVDMFVTVFKGQGSNAKLLGMGITGRGANGASDQGQFKISLSEPPDSQTYVYFWPMIFDEQGQPRMAIAKAKTQDALSQQSNEYWSFGFNACGVMGAPDCNPTGDTDTGPLLVDIKSNSGAINIYQWIDYGIFRFANLFQGKGGQPLSFAVFWSPSIAFDCGNCFVPPQGGGATVTYDASSMLVDHYDAAMNISGDADNPSHFSKSVVNHEFGHWTMASYSRSPNEGGPHYVDQASKPGLAYSEGYATFTGQTQISADNAKNNPIYFTKQQGTVFWVDISKNVWSDGALQKPDPNGPIDQDINENIVSGMLWSFWAQLNAAAPQALGDGPVFGAMRSQRLLGDLDRGYPKVNWVDYLDALKCDKVATDAQITGVVNSVGFPYDFKPLCP